MVQGLGFSYAEIRDTRGRVLGATGSEGRRPAACRSRRTGAASASCAGRGRPLRRGPTGTLLEALSHQIGGAVHTAGLVERAARGAGAARDGPGAGTAPAAQRPARRPRTRAGRDGVPARRRPEPHRRRPARRGPPAPAARRTERDRRRGAADRRRTAPAADRRPRAVRGHRRARSGAGGRRGTDRHPRPARPATRAARGRRGGGVPRDAGGADQRRPARARLAVSGLRVADRRRARHRGRRRRLWWRSSRQRARDPRHARPRRRDRRLGGGVHAGAGYGGPAAAAADAEVAA